MGRIARRRKKYNVWILLIRVQLFIALLWQRAKTNLNVLAGMNLVEIQFKADKMTDFFYLTGVILNLELCVCTLLLQFVEGAYYKINVGIHFLAVHFYFGNFVGA